jgi:hypothetical protein
MNSFFDPILLFAFHCFLIVMFVSFVLLFNDIVDLFGLNLLLICLV